MILSLAIAGGAGRMGLALVRAAENAEDLQVVGASERAGAASLGQDVGALAGIGPIGVALTDKSAEAALTADVWIDFTAPEATIAALEAMGGAQVRAAIIGTTGFSAAQEAQLSKAAERLAIVRSGNFSLGVTLLAALTRQAAQRLGVDWDIEILEMHHRHKADAPSGTALLLGEAAAAGRGDDLKALRLKPYDGKTGARPEGKIGFAVQRGGGVVGEHAVTFASEREIVRLSHQALDRAIFADGALVAARWAAKQPAGLYSMQDVLGL
ncbi:MAG: 4-hydroxy-tetrahydrodipicolinate reductase [Hyphomonadaceae bacterium]